MQQYRAVTSSGEVSDSFICPEHNIRTIFGGKTILYADRMTDSMKKAIVETNRRREIQQEYNRKNNITPQSIKKRIDEVMTSVYERDYFDYSRISEEKDIYLSPQKRKEKMEKLEKLMNAASRNLEFEKAAKLRDELNALKKRELELVV